MSTILDIEDRRDVEVIMSFAEKNTWVFAVVSLIGALAYGAIVLSRASGGAIVDVAYGGPMLGTIGGAVLAGIVAQVVIATTSEAEKKDQRDREIDRFGTWVGQAFLVLGGLAALGMAMAETSHFWIAQALYLGFVLSALFGAVAKIVAYRRGIAPA